MTLIPPGSIPRSQPAPTRPGALRAGLTVTVAGRGPAAAPPSTARPGSRAARTVPARPGTRWTGARANREGPAGPCTVQADRTSGPPPVRAGSLSGGWRRARARGRRGEPGSVTPYCTQRHDHANSVTESVTVE
eukprot:760224-Hanusia_phi.AAC.3